MLSLNPATNKIKYKSLKKIVLLTSKMARKYSFLAMPFSDLADLKVIDEDTEKIFKSQFYVYIPMISISY